MEIVKSGDSKDKGPAIMLLHTPWMEQPVTEGAAQSTQSPENHPGQKHGYQEWYCL